MEEINFIIKGKFCKIVIDDKLISMQTEETGNALIPLGKPLEIKRELIMSRNKHPQIYYDFVNAWKKEDIEKVAKMETDLEMKEDMLNDFKEMGFEILE